MLIPDSLLTHKNIWQAIDRLAARHSLSASGLARRAGLDPTTFNRSKRASREGKPRWPSTESIAKILDATGEPLASFVDLVGAPAPAGRNMRVPVIGMAKAGEAGYFDDAGYPAGHGWDEIPFPDTGDPRAFALEISGDSMAPVFRDGTIIVVSPEASIRRGDRVVARTRAGEVMAKELVRRTARTVELASVNAAYPARTLEASEIAWMARIVWASQ